MQIVIKKSPRELLKGMGLDTKQIQRVTLAIGKAVQESFKARNEKMETKEIERRTEICFVESVKMIGDWDFAVAQVERYLSDALRCNLIGIEYQPTDRLLANRK